MATGDAGVLRSRVEVFGRDQHGFTLPEVLTVVAILGILIAIAVIIWLGILERRRVDAAANQLAADLRLAHTNATNQLTDWRVVLVLNRGDEDDGPDYYLVKLGAPYPETTPTPVERIPRTFPGNVKTKIPATRSGVIVDNQNAPYWVAPWDSPPSPTIPQTRTLEFNTDGTAKVYEAAAGSACVTVDDDPNNRVYVGSATSRVRIEADGCTKNSGS